LAGIGACAAVFTSEEEKAQSPNDHKDSHDSNDDLRAADLLLSHRSFTSF
jgi:hypothetical protein